MRPQSIAMVFATWFAVATAPLPASAEAALMRAQVPLRVTGIVNDTAGSPIPGAEIFVSGRDGRAALTDARGLFEIVGLAPGEHEIRAKVFGFRVRRLRVSLPQQSDQRLTFVMRIGLISEDPLTVALKPHEVVRGAHAIARVRMEGLSKQMFKCDDLDRMTAIHDATVIEVWKGRLPTRIQITEEGIGRCVEEDGSISAHSARSEFQEGSEYIVFLSRIGARFSVWLRSDAPSFLVNGGLVETKGFLESPPSLKLDDFRRRLMRLR